MKTIQKILALIYRRCWSRGADPRQPKIKSKNPEKNAEDTDFLYGFGGYRICIEPFVI